MAPSNDLPIHIPPFAKPLAPYIKPRQEALHIRQALTSYLRSLVVFADDADPSSYSQSHLALCTPGDTVVNVKRIPADLPGLRKEYLKALQANVAARKDYRAVLGDVAALRRQQVSKGLSVEVADLQEPGADLRDYLQLLRDRRRHTKLQVFQHYLEELRAKESDGSHDTEEAEDSIQQLQRLPEGLDTHAPGDNATGTDLEELVHKLERAVVRARTQLDREKHLFEKIKVQHAARKDASLDEVNPGLKARGLQRTRDELVQWVEARLASEGDPEDSLIQDLPPEEIEEAQRLLQHQKMQISEQYAAYIEARRTLLDAASRACQPVAVTSKHPPRSTYKTEVVSNEISAPDPLDILSYTTETLVPLSKSQKALALQKTYLTGLLAKEKSTTLRALHRLSDESHLLPEYPILARQPRFKQAVATLNARNSAPSTNRPEPDEVADLAKAWAFASDAAATSEREYVQQKVMLGTEVAQDARKLLRDIYNTLNQDLHAVLQEGAEQDPEASDIWASEALSTRKAGMGLSGSSRLEKRPKGPWSGLNGRVGLE